MKEHTAKSSRIIIEKNESEKLSLPPKTIELLTKTGLPSSAPLGVSFQRCDTAIAVSTNSAGKELYAIGSDEGSTICLKSDEGTVVSVDQSGEELRKINSELSYFLMLLDMYSKYAEKVQAMNESAAEAYSIQVGNEMKEVDPPAFNDPDDWWPSITQQMEFGML